MLTVAEAQARILDAADPLPAESVALDAAAHRFLARAVSAPISLPPFDNSAMDGYAVRAEEIRLASPEKPVALKKVGILPAGARIESAIEAGECVRIFTGSPMPHGADAVAMQEDCTVIEGSPTIAVNCPVTPWENVRFAGEDVKAGAPVGEIGDRMTPGRLALFAALGLERVECFQRPRVALFSTGDELAAPGTALVPGMIYESNRAGLAALCDRVGATTLKLPTVRDDRAALVARLSEAFGAADLVISTGGVSVGEFDFVKTAFADLGGRTEFWKVAVKPGKPLVFGRLGPKLFLGLPGNPVSALVGMTLFGIPALRRMAGARDPLPDLRDARLDAPIENRGDRPHYVRVVLNREGGVRMAGVQASHVLSSAAAADGLLEIPAKTRLETGAAVRVLTWF